MDTPNAAEAHALEQQIQTVEIDAGDRVAQWAAARMIELRKVIEIGLDGEVQAALSAAIPDESETD